MKNETFNKLNQISNQELNLRLEKLVRSERKLTHLILDHILEFENRRLYAAMGFDSMFSYLTRHLGYSESSAYRRIQSSRLLKKVPEAAIPLESGALNLSQLAQVQKCLREQSQKGKEIPLNKTQEILETLQNCNSFETQQILARAFDKPIQVQEVAKPQRDDSVRLELTFTKEQFEELKDAKSLLSHICVDGNWAEVISIITHRFNRSKLGKEKTGIQINSLNSRQSEAGFELKIENLTQHFVAEVPKNQSENKAEQSNPITTKRTYISVETKRHILKNAKYSCEFLTSQGIRCGSRFQLQIDHRIPLACGGTNDPENLRALCRTHNLFAFKTLNIFPFMPNKREIDSFIRRKPKTKWCIPAP